MTKGNLKGCHYLIHLAPLCRLGVYLLKSTLKCPLGRLLYHERTSLLGRVSHSPWLQLRAHFPWREQDLVLTAGMVHWGQLDLPKPP